MAMGSGLHIGIINGRGRAAAVAIVILATAIASRGSAQVAPARRVDVVDRYPGFSVADPYRWMEDAGSADVKAWAKSQDSVTRAFLDARPERAAMLSRLGRGFIVRTDTTPLVAGVPQRRGSAVFAIRVARGQPPAIARYEGSLDGSRHDIKPVFPGLSPAAGWLVSPDGRFIAYLNSREGAWHVIDVSTRAEGADSVAGPQSNDSLAWTPDGSGFYYTKSGAAPASPDGVAGPPSQQIRFHKLGTSQSEDRIVFELPERPEMRLRPDLTSDGSYLVVTAARPTDPFSRIFIRPLGAPDAPAVELSRRPRAWHRFVGSDGARLFFQTTVDAPRGRIVAIDPTRLGERSWRTVIPQSAMTINIAQLLGGRLVVLYAKDALPRLQVHDLAGRLEREVPLPFEGHGSPWFNPASGPRFIGTPRDGEAYFVFLPAFSTQPIYRLDITAGRTSIVSQQRPAFSTDDFELRQVFYRSKDGTRVPMLLASKKGVPHDGTAPVYLSTLGGAFGWFSFYWYTPNSPLHAWIELGGVVALPQARGGGEYGLDWRLAANGATKQKSVDDFIGAAEWVIANRVGSAKTLVLDGSGTISALAGAVLNQRPELFGAALFTFPLFDMLRYERWPGGWQYRGEFGSMEHARERAALRAYSPYHNVRGGACYPPTLIVAGELDGNAYPAHAYKQFAALQHAQHCQNPIRLSVLWGQGYGAATTAPALADQLAFLMHALSIPVDRVPGGP
jgi:prolyl oligopeptidase